MKKKICFIIVLVLCLMTTGCSKHTDEEYEELESKYEALQEKYCSKVYVDDGEGLFTSEEKTELSEILEEASYNYHCDIVFASTPSFNGKSAMNYADDYYERNDYGQGMSNDGIVMIISVAEREVYFSTMGNMITTMYNSRLESLLNEVTQLLSDEKYFDAVETYAQTVRNYVK